MNVQSQKMSKEKKEFILSAAIELFAKYGYYQTRPKDIAQLAGISVGLLYHYFPSKEDLFKAAFWHVTDILDEVCSQIVQDKKEKNLEERLLILSSRILEKVEENYYLFELWLLEKEVETVFRTDYTRLVKKFHLSLRKVFLVDDELKNLSERCLFWLESSFFQLIKQFLLLRKVKESDSQLALLIPNNFSVMVSFFIGGIKELKERGFCQ